MSKLNSSVDGANSINHMNSSSWSSINAEYVARMRLQNQFKTGIEINFVDNANYAGLWSDTPKIKWEEDDLTSSR